LKCRVKKRKKMGSSGGDQKKGWPGETKNKTVIWGENTTNGHIEGILDPNKTKGCYTRRNSKSGSERRNKKKKNPEYHMGVESSRNKPEGILRKNDWAFR